MTDILYQSVDALSALRFALFFSLAIVFGRYLYMNRAHIFEMRYRMDRIHSAVAFFTFFAFESIWRGFVWLFHSDVQATFSLHPGFYFIFITSGVGAAIGAVCCLRVLLPEWWNYPTWLAIFGFVALTIILTLAGVV